MQTVIGEITAGVRRAHPEIALDLQSARFSGDALERLRAGELDVAIGRRDVPESRGNRCRREGPVSDHTETMMVWV